MDAWHVDGFTEVKELGSGAQGRVVLAVTRHQEAQGQVAIKYLAPGLLADERSRRRFREEAKTLSWVTDPHVAQLYDFVEHPRGAAIVMEVVPGLPLREILTRGEGLMPETALSLLKGSLLGLGAAHKAGIVHGDYKPANVIVQWNGSSKLIDFGIAVMAGRATRAGTPAYMAPEKWNNAPASPASDLYAAGCVFFECVTGAKPYQGRKIEQLMAQHASTPPPLEAVPEPLRPLLARTMAKDPAQRPSDVDEFVNDLERIAVAAYGPDWQRRGMGALAVTAAAVASGTSAVLGTLGAGAAIPPFPYSLPDHQMSQAPQVPHGDAPVQKGHLFGRVGGAKTVVAGTAALVAAAAVTVGGAALRDDPSLVKTKTTASGSPSPLTVGGQATGSLNGGFRDLERLDVGKMPTMALDVTAAPARVKPGTKLTITMESTHRDPRGIGTFGYTFGSAGSARAIGLYPAPPAKTTGVPSGEGIRVASKADDPDGGDTRESGDWRVTQLTFTITATIPADGSLPSGRYLLAPFTPVSISEVRVRDKTMKAEEAGAYLTGSLPVITVLP